MRIKVGDTVRVVRCFNKELIGVTGVVVCLLGLTWLVNVEGSPIEFTSDELEAIE